MLTLCFTGKLGFRAMGSIQSSSFCDIPKSNRAYIDKKKWLQKDIILFQNYLIALHRS